MAEFSSNDERNKLQNDIYELNYLLYELKSIENINNEIQSVNDQLKTENNVFEKELRWCFDSDGQRNLPTPKAESLRISQLIAEHPDTEDDVVHALKTKASTLQMEVYELQDQLKQAKRKHRQKES